jgi:hypothetical protein
VPVELAPDGTAPVHAHAAPHRGEQFHPTFAHLAHLEVCVVHRAPPIDARNIATASRRVYQ